MPVHNYYCIITLLYDSNYDDLLCYYVVPLKAPPIVLADRTEATTALIEWEILSQEDLRGNLSSHEIVYFNLLEAECPPTTIGTSSSHMVSFIGTEPQFVITDLDPGLQYCVGVAAKTGAGLGDFSYSLIPCKYIVLNQHAKQLRLCIMIVGYLWIIMYVLSLLQGIATACSLCCCWKYHPVQSGL